MKINLVMIVKMRSVLWDNAWSRPEGLWMRL